MKILSPGYEDKDAGMGLGYKAGRIQSEQSRVSSSARAPSRMGEVAGCSGARRPATMKAPSRGIVPGETAGSLRSIMLEPWHSQPEVAMLRAGAHDQ